jgi:hypothetical protein
MATINPDPCGAMICAACRAATKLDRTPTSTICQSDSGFSQNGAGSVRFSGSANALLTRMSSRPCSRSTCANSAATASSSAWSTGTAMPVPPRRETSSAVSPTVPGNGEEPGVTVRPVT